MSHQETDGCTQGGGARYTHMSTTAQFVGILKKSEASWLTDQLETRCVSDPVSLEEIKGTDFVVLFRNRGARELVLDCYELESICEAFLRLPNATLLPASRMVVTNADRERILRFGRVMGTRREEILDLNDDDDDSD